MHSTCFVLFMQQNRCKWHFKKETKRKENNCSTYWSRLITLSLPLLSTVEEDEEEERIDRCSLWVACASLGILSVLNASLLLSRERPLMTPDSFSYSTLKIKLTLRARDSTSKFLNEKTLKSLAISLTNLRKQNSRKQRIWRKQSLLLLKKRTLSVDVSNGEPKEVAYVAKLREKYESLDWHTGSYKNL